ncbi:MAG: hypothetical protein P4M01_13685 [Acidobacteriota bacterium]|nr:hypothetical protein [Acidobacteriota bacterium]
MSKVVKKSSNHASPQPAALTREEMQRGEHLLVVAVAAIISLAAFSFFFTRGDILLYGDAVAHLNIARRLTDSRNAGWNQIGTVWLPLPHLLAAPFVAFSGLWRNGIGASIPSMGAFILGVLGMYRLVRGRASALAASLAAAIYALNPSLLFLQSTAMTESIFLCAFVWSIAYLDEFLRALRDKPDGSEASLPAWKALERCGLCLAAGIFTRYDGWFYAFFIGITAVVAAARWIVQHRGTPQAGRLTRSAALFLLLMALCPVLWLAHNYKNSGRPLDWFNGPYSAKAIEQRTSRPGDPPYPGKNHPFVAAEYFLKAARMNTGEGGREYWLIALAAAGVAISLARHRRFAPMLLLWLPLPFYAYSVAFGSVPIFVPEWWPFSYYNVRYGLELLPAFAVFAAVLPWAVGEWKVRRAETFAYALVFVAMFGAYQSSAMCASKRSQDRFWGRGKMIPLCYREAWANSRTRLPLDRQLGDLLAQLPEDSTVMMNTSEHVGAIQLAGIPFRRVISESTFIGWDAALSAPWATADYVVAFTGDPVDKAVHLNPRGLTKLTILHVQDGPSVSLYRTSRR